MAPNSRHHLLSGTSSPPVGRGLPVEGVHIGSRQFVKCLLQLVGGPGGGVQQLLDRRKKMRVQELSVISWDGLAFLRPRQVAAYSFDCQRNDRIVRSACSEEIRAAA